MTIEQQNKVLIQIENLRKIDLDKKLVENYPNHTEIANIQISKMTVSEFLSLTKRILSQIVVEIKSENRLILPFTFSSQEYGLFNLEQALIDLNSQISNKQLASAENSLLKIAQYSLQNGFYDKAKYKVHSIENLKLEKTKDNLDLISENYNQLKKKYDNLLSELEKSKTNLKDFHTKKETEFKQITNNLNTSNTNNSHIQELLTSSTRSQTKINTLSQQADKEMKNIENVKTEINKQYLIFKTNFDLLIKELEVSDENFKLTYTDFEAKLQFVEEKTNYFEERNEYLDNLIGREVGASLFETFKQRKLELNKPLRFWKWSVGVMAAFTSILIFAIFTNFFGFFGEDNSDLRWEHILVNTLKSSPFFFLLYYSIAQYNKERSFQEEYAFKSASALTIKAYSNIINDETKKDELILKAVYGIYKSPMYNRSKSTKEVNSTLKMLEKIVKKGNKILTKK